MHYIIDSYNGNKAELMLYGIIIFIVNKFDN